MKRQVLQIDRVTGRAVVAYIDRGPGRAEPGHGRGLSPIAVPSSGLRSTELGHGRRVNRLGGTA